ncbi:MAG: hypothetical protein UY48_C0003G0053 [Candidatus Gottesmanbacteria bacterium GW2011_GWB1_49_7]|uniref:Uncharacterized protein n=1 Tax=Candidatus Gottesmanbacteria bacterium GW2011_GWB1_49_7 TaxID=1618448 RepID=A0A0G1W397_9BACT|nr:MAG: hypothetical protein UY48_C0003G0053 [Candidatus Gottesmanbacteria bacterium GW2011_GWB1_49_7]
MKYLPKAENIARDVVVPLEEVSDFPESGNPVVSLLVRIEDAYASMLENRDPRDPYGSGRRDRYDEDIDDFVEMGRPARDSMETLQRLSVLMATAALACDGNVRQRAGELDPDPYAYEVIRAENCRVGLPTTFKLVMNDLQRDWQRRKYRTPIFVLPFVDYEFNFQTHHKFLNTIDRFLGKNLRAVIITEGPLIQAAGRRKWETMTEEEFVTFVRDGDYDS